MMKWRTAYDGPKKRSGVAKAVTTIPQQVVPDKRDKLKEKAEKAEKHDE